MSASGSPKDLLKLLCDDVKCIGWKNTNALSAVKIVLRKFTESHKKLCCLKTRMDRVHSMATSALNAPEKGRDSTQKNIKI